MRLATAQMHWGKKVKADYLVIDTTTKSGLDFLAPGWDIVKRVKEDASYSDEYTRIYLNRLRQRYRENPEQFHELCRSPQPVLLLCYCPKGKFCHRHLLVDVFKNLCRYLKIEFVYEGELQ